MLTHSNIFIDVHRQAPIILLFYGFVCNIKQKYPVHVRFTRAELKDEKFHLSAKKNRLRVGLVYATGSKGLAKYKTATKKIQEIVFFPNKRNRNRDHNMWAMKVREKRIRKGIGQFGAYCNSKQKRNRKTQINDRLRSRPKEKHQKMLKLSVFWFMVVKGYRNIS